MGLGAITALNYWYVGDKVRVYSMLLKRDDKHMRKVKFPNRENVEIFLVSNTLMVRLARLRSPKC